jgi:hypothetical protein
LHTAPTPEGPWEPLLNVSTGKPALLADGLNANPTVWVDPSSGEVTLLYGTVLTFEPICTGGW